MKRAALILAALAAILTAAAAPVRTATENFVANKIAEAVAAIPAPDYSTNNAALVATIQAKAPAPGNYATVSNAAVHAAITNALQDAAIGSLVNTVSEKPDVADIPPAVSNIVTTALVRERLGVWMEYDEATGFYYYCHEEE